MADSQSTTHTCLVCGGVFPWDHFVIDPRYVSGRGSECLVCKRKRDRERHRRRYQTLDRERERQRVKNRKRSPDPQRWRARSALKRAIKKGIVVRPATCEHCGATGVRIQGHHHDYMKPLDVWWLCQPCHGAAHRSQSAALALKSERDVPSV